MYLLGFIIMPITYSIQVQILINFNFFKAIKWNDLIITYFSQELYYFLLVK